MHEVFMCVGVEIHHLWNVGVPYSQENNQSSILMQQELRHFNISFFTVKSDLLYERKAEQTCCDKASTTIQHIESVNSLSLFNRSMS